jgi:hypothetical protein
MSAKPPTADPVSRALDRLAARAASPAVAGWLRALAADRGDAAGPNKNATAGDQPRGRVEKAKTRSARLEGPRLQGGARRV